MQTNLKYSDNGPEKTVKVLAVGDGVTVLCPKAELTSKQMHAQNTADNKKMQLFYISWCVFDGFYLVFPHTLT